MHILVLYDISDDRARARIARICEDYGLDRIQFSVFYGTLTRNLREELTLRCDHILGDVGGRVLLVPVSFDTWKQRLMVEHE